MNEHKQNNKQRESEKSFFEKFIWKPKCFCIHYNSSMKHPQLNKNFYSIKATQQSCVESERVC